MSHLKCANEKTTHCHDEKIIIVKFTNREGAIVGTNSSDGICSIAVPL